MSQNNLFLLFLILLFFSYLIAINRPLIAQTQTYSYNDKNLEVIFSINKMSYSEEDTLYINISIKNITYKDIYIFRDILLKRKFNRDAITINWAGDFSGNIEYDVEMNVITGDSSVFYFKKYPIKELKDSNNNFQKIILDFAYLDISNDNFLNFQKSNTKYSFIIDKNKLIINSILLEMFLTKINYGVLWYSIKNQ